MDLPIQAGVGFAPSRADHPHSGKIGKGLISRVTLPIPLPGYDGYAGMSQKHSVKHVTYYSPKTILTIV